MVGKVYDCKVYDCLEHQVYKVYEGTCSPGAVNPKELVLCTAETHLETQETDIAVQLNTLTQTNSTL